MGALGGSGLELLPQDPRLESVAGIEQHGERLLRAFPHGDLDRVGDLTRVRGRRRRPLVGVEDLEVDCGL